MQNSGNYIIWVYILLLLVGGLIGFWKAGSKVSLIMSASFAAVLALTTIPRFLDRQFAHTLCTILMAALLVVFAVRLTKTKKFMPSGLMLVITAVALGLLNLRF
jgi:uncharacterized membrane protein (UPF0136 family)